MGSYNRKQCSAPTCDELIYDGNAMCEDHDSLITEFFDRSDMPVGIVQQVHDGNVLQFAVRDGSFFSMNAGEMERILTEFGWSVTRPGMGP